MQGAYEKNKTYIYFYVYEVFKCFQVQYEVIKGIRLC